MIRTGRIFAFFVVTAAAVVLSGCHKKEGAVLARVDGTPVYAEDFRTRYKQYLQETSQRDNIVLRKRILDNMIGEVLIREELHRQGLDRDSAAETRLEDIRREALAMGYAKRITLDTLTITRQEVAEEFRKSRLKYHARYVYARTEEEAWKLHDRLQNGETYESIARQVFDDPGLAGNGGDLGFVGWGEMEAGMEKVGYEQPIGEISDPVKLKVGWAVIRIDERVDAQPLAGQSEFEKVKEKLEAAVSKRKIFAVLDSSAARVVRSMDARFNESAVKEAFAGWRLALDSAAVRYPTEQAWRVDKSDTLFMEFGKGEKWTLKDFFGKLRHTTNRERRFLHSEDDLKKFALGLAARDIMVQRAIDAGLEKDTSVVAQMKRLSDEYFLRRWASSIQDTVGAHGWDDQFLRQQYSENQAQYGLPPMIDVAEILVRTKEEAARLYRRAVHGEDFSQLARANSIRTWAARKGGDLGYGPKASYGIYADTFAHARIGTIIGPLFVDPYYGVFRINGKSDARTRTFEEARDDVIKSAGFMKKQEALRQGVSALRGHSDVQIDNSLLENISLNTASQ